MPALIKRTDNTSRKAFYGKYMFYLKLVSECMDWIAIIHGLYTGFDLETCSKELPHLNPYYLWAANQEEMPD